MLITTPQDMYDILEPTFAALIPARPRLRFALTYAAARRITIIIIKKEEKKKSPVPGIEPARRAPLGFEVHRLNHSASEAALHVIYG